MCEPWLAGFGGRSVASGAGLAACLVLGACADRGRSGSAANASDACEGWGAEEVAAGGAPGVEVVVGVEPAWAEGEAPRVGPRPVLSIGVTDGPEPYEFGSIAAAARLEDGRIVIADGQAAEIRVFDPAGEFIEAVGGRGSGPGEYETITGMFRSAGDTLWVEDRRQRRITVLAPDLAVVETIRVTAVPAASGIRIRPTLRGVLADGAWISSHGISLFRDPQASTVFRDSLILHRVDPAGGTIDSLGLILGVQRYEYLPGDGSVWFGDLPLGYVETLAVAGDRYFYGDAKRFEIEERAPDGRLVRRIRLCEETETIDPVQLDRVIEDRLSDSSDELRDGEERAMRGVPRSDLAPAFLQLLVDAEERLWVRDFTYPGTPQRWMVFDRDGVWLGAVESPADPTVLEIGSDYMLARHSDALGVHSVRLYPLSRAVPVDRP